MKRYLIFILFFLLPTSPALAQKRGQARIDSLLQELPKAKNDTNRTIVFYTLSYAYQSFNTDEGIKYGLKGVALAQKMKWKYAMAQSYIGIGNNYNFKSDYPKTLDYYFMALKIYEEMGSKSDIASTSSIIGNVYINQSDYVKALEYDSIALTMEKEIGSPVKESTAITLVNMGNIYAQQSNYPKALEYYNESLKLDEELGDKYGITRAIGNMGNIYQNQKNYNKGLEYDFKALKASYEMGDKSFIAAILGNIGSCYADIANDTTETIKPDSLIPAGKKANLYKAIEYLNIGIDSAKKIGYLAVVQNCSQILSETQMQLGNYKGALESHLQYVAAKDSMFNIENNEKIEKLETQRELDLKDKQIIIDRLEVAKKRDERWLFITGIAGLLVVMAIIYIGYRKQKTTNRLLSLEKGKVELRTEELDQMNHELNATLENLQLTQEQLVQTEKQKENEMIRNRISQDIHDDISSELTRISWMSSMAKRKIANSETEEVKAILERIIASSGETIGKLGEIIWAINPENDNIESLTGYMRHYVAKFFEDSPFGYAIDFPERLPLLPISPELKRNLFLVVKEALNNAAKYSKATLVSVSLRLEDNHYRLSVADDGIGIDEKITQGGGNGLKNMQLRMASVKGKCTILSKPGQGAQVIFEGMLY